jgi:hypothetical protein
VVNSALINLAVQVSLLCVDLDEILSILAIFCTEEVHMEYYVQNLTHTVFSVWLGYQLDTQIHLFLLGVNFFFCC